MCFSLCTSILCCSCFQRDFIALSEKVLLCLLSFYCLVFFLLLSELTYLIFNAASYTEAVGLVRIMRHMIYKLHRLV